MELKYKIAMGGSAIMTWFLGPLDMPLQTLIFFMGADFITGVIKEKVFGNSDKSDTGKISSKASFKGICKKGVMLIFVMIAYRLDLMAGTNLVRNTVITAFLINEVISINENAICMGIDVPSIVVDTVKSWKK